MITFEELEKTINKTFEGELEIFFKETPNANHLTSKENPLNKNYYIRHRIETIKRIKLTARTDALALAEMINLDYQISREWSKYSNQEMNHDLMFMGDLRRHGITDGDVDGTEPFLATTRLIEYIESEIVEKKSPAAAVAYSMFVEWNSDRYSQAAVEKAAASFTHDHVKGAAAHISFDEQHDHLELMYRIVHKLLEKGLKVEEFCSIAKNISREFRNYFAELSEDSKLEPTLQPN